MYPIKFQLPALYIAWSIALVSTLSALFIGEVMGKSPCILCWYQRIAMFPLAFILGLACLQSDYAVRRYAIPLAAAGGAFALWHSLLFLGFIPEPIQPCLQSGPSCAGDDQVLFGLVPLPFLSFLAFISIIILLSYPFRKRTL
ncbi:disulfide bond formation protein B [Curvivirga sp.]|uniref:disulfide bond formation protein B n=1 Tax=Curvivirga sp. TaxID=2856848 RepID=UPI003B5CB464